MSRKVNCKVDLCNRQEVFRLTLVQNYRLHNMYWRQAVSNVTNYSNLAELTGAKTTSLLNNNSVTLLLGLNGTTRWFLLEHPTPQSDDFLKIYTDITSARMAEICDMLFSNGVHSLLIPVLNQTLLKGRSEQYAQMMLEALPNIAGGGFMDDVYAKHEVGVSFYGEYETILNNSGNGRLLDSFQKIEDDTKDNKKHQIFWGVFAKDELSTGIDTAVDYFQKTGEKATPDQLIQHYYGRNIPPVDIYITSGKPRLFDAPFLLNGRMDMYFMASPSLYLTQSMFHNILYDHLHSRKNGRKHTELDERELLEVRDYYRKSKNNVMGIGSVHPEWGIWYPPMQALS